MKGGVKSLFSSELGNFLIRDDNISYSAYTRGDIIFFVKSFLCKTRKTYFAFMYLQ